MTDIDAMLARLRDAPAHPDLPGIDDAVLDRLAPRSEGAASPGIGGIGIAAAIAMVVGIVGSVWPPAPVRASSTAPFGAPSALAPSSLLGHE